MYVHMKMKRMYIRFLMKAITNRLLTSYVGTYLQLFSLFKIRLYDIVPKTIRAFPFILRAFLLNLPPHISVTVQHPR